MAKAKSKVGKAKSKVGRNRPKKPKSGGRQKGTPNKITTDTRKAFADLVQGRADKVGGWLDRVAKRDPARACEIIIKLAEYHIPKLSRTEHTGEGGGPVQTRDVTAIEAARRLCYLLESAMRDQGRS